MTDKPDYAANLAFFLLSKTGTVLGQWCGKLPADEQRKLMGQFLGKETLLIDGSTETVVHKVLTCGRDSDVTARLTWRDLVNGTGDG